MAQICERDEEPNDAASETAVHPRHSLHAPSPSPYLPLELVEEILRKLPVKFLQQLRCVSNSINSLISDHRFCKKHLRDSTIRHQLTSSETAYPLPSSVFNAVTTTQLKYPPNVGSRLSCIVGSCNGLLCLFNKEGQFFILWNPSIRKSKILPALENPYRFTCSMEFGFGYDNVADNYKLVVVIIHGAYFISPLLLRHTEVKVHTLGTNSWRTIEEFPVPLSCIEQGIFVSRTVNWFVSQNDPFGNETCNKSIVSLDLGKESYQELSQPDYGEVVKHRLILGVLRDFLCIVSHTEAFSDIWVMKEYGNKESWTKLFRVPHMGVLTSCVFTRALYISEDDQLLLEFLSNLFSYEFVVYDFRSGILKNPNIKKRDGWMNPEVYIESLISPCSLC